MNKKIKVCLLFGGKSGEHEVSIMSARSIYQSLDKQRYEVYLVGIDKNGKWLLGNSLTTLLQAKNSQLAHLEDDKSSTPVTALSTDLQTELIALDSQKPIAQIDVFFPITHGTYGEGGSLQGFLELMDAAYVGAGVLGSSVGMDKDVSKRLLSQAGLAVAKYAALKKKDITDERIDLVIKQLSWPIFVKPANLGSSVGVSKVHTKKELVDAINSAFQYDTKVLCEEYIDGREIECAVLGNDDPIVSIPGEIIPQDEFYTYAAKYIDENGARLEVPANLTQKQVKEFQKIAKQAFVALEGSGMARVDFFLRKADGKIFVNELNSLPGFTHISLYPRMWEHTGISYSQLLDRLIELAFEKKQMKNALKRSFDLE